MANPLFSEIEAGTLEAFVKNQVARTLFTATPWLRVMRTNKDMFRPWQGGSYMKVPFDLQPSPSGAYSPGTDTFGLQQLQTEDAMAFSPKFYNAEVVINAATTDVYNVGASQIVNILKEKYGNASNSMDSKIAAAVYNHGQAAGATVTSNRIFELNGFAEGINDGVTPSWTSDIFTTYGNQLRNGPLTKAVLNSVPYWGGNTDGSAGPVSNQILNRTYNRCKQGKGEGKILGGKPDYGLCSDFMYGSVSDRIFPMQRVDAEIKEPRIGLTGMKFNNAIIFPDSYSPGTQNSLYIQDTSVLPSITTGTFALPAGAVGSTILNGFSSLTAGTTINVNETFWWLNSGSWRFSYPKTGRYSFKNRGLLEAFDGDILADIYRAAIVMYTLVPSSNQLTYGYSG